MPRFVLSSVFAVVLVCAVAIANASGLLTGVVKASHPADPYVYLQLDQQGKEVWVAVRALPVKQGDQVEYAPGQLMTNFTSKTLGRTFEQIYFVSQLRVVGQPGAVSSVAAPDDAMHRQALGIQAQAPASGAPDDATHRQALGAPTQPNSPKPGQISKLADGKTIDEVYGSADKLNTQVVRLRAQVMKVNRQILGKNWVTLADGTGVAPNNVLVATTQQDLQPGIVVVVEGTVRTNVDLGAGYTYPVLLEQAKFQ